MELGIFALVRLTLAHLENLPTPIDRQCNVLSEELCTVFLKDSYTTILTIWGTLQLTWVTMLLVVQLVQISRAQTTYENMRHSHDQGGKAAEAITSALTSGTTSLAGAQLTSSGMGPDPAISSEHHHGHAHGEGWFSRWKKLLGLDTFVTTALHGYEGSKNRSYQRGSRGNPFSRGVMTNCRDFWCDPQPIFGKRETGVSMLDGEVINYARMYETPPRMKVRRTRQGNGDSTYHSVGADEEV
ncbi:MAG: palmitoyltransferase akr1 [Pycnora praestabilis]|nr:MAG: palmitoyltransferase akr1 [Pycnora praestabilis]